MSEALQQLAARCGIDATYTDALGQTHRTDDALRLTLLAAMHLPADRLRDDPSGLLAEREQYTPPPPRAAPAGACHRPAALADNRRLWGIAVQLYSVRSRRNWGIGDFTDLANLLEFTAAAGGAFVGVNPLHALFPDNPRHISPYSPSQRAFLNPLYIDVAALPELSICPDAQRRLASADFCATLTRLRAADCVDYPTVAALKESVLRQLFMCQSPARRQAFAAWRAAAGDALEQLARHEAGDSADNDYRAWLQWLADEQLAAAAARGRRAGLTIGLYRDLAIGANPTGAEARRWPSVFARGVYTGAPPDEINAMGQDWGLPPFAPDALRACAYAPFIEVLRANMQHAGALRIDHVMGLQRLFWVPAGQSAVNGTYVQYPFDDLLGIVVEESRRNHCLVIGEDLGTVPPGFRERLLAAGVFSYHPMIFEREADGQFRLPHDYPPQALATLSTHDLPTLRGFWAGLDLELRATLGLLPSHALHQRLVTERGWDRGRLRWALEREHLLPEDFAAEPTAANELPTAAIAAIHAFLARSSAQLFSVQAEDLLGVLHQANLPGTLEDKHPNWQQRLPVDLEDWATHPRTQAVLAAIRRERGTATTAAQRE